jgi:hypothetical protein
LDADKAPDSTSETEKAALSARQGPSWLILLIWDWKTAFELSVIIFGHATARTAFQRSKKLISPNFHNTNESSSSTFTVAQDGHREGGYVGWAVEMSVTYEYVHKAHTHILHSKITSHRV